MTWTPCWMEPCELPGANRIAVERHFPGVLSLHSGDDLDDRRFTRTVGTGQAMHFALADGEADVVQSLQSAVVLADVAHTEDVLFLSAMAFSLHPQQTD